MVIGGYTWSQVRYQPVSVQMFTHKTHTVRTWLGAVYGVWGMGMGVFNVNLVKLGFVELSFFG